MLVVKRLRQDAGISQAELARRCGMHPSTVCAIERGRLNPYPGQVEKIVEALSWQGDPAELFREEASDGAA